MVKFFRPRIFIFLQFFVEVYKSQQKSFPQIFHIFTIFHRSVEKSRKILQNFSSQISHIFTISQCGKIKNFFSRIFIFLLILHFFRNWNTDQCLSVDSIGGQVYTGVCSTWGDFTSQWVQLDESTHEL